MTLTLNLPPEVEDRLHTEAGRHGLAPEELALRLLQRDLIALQPERPSTADEFDALMEEISAEIDPSLPPLSNEALRREAIYGEWGV